jgi:DNA-binding GntR family transcriptional regulator
LRVLEGEKLIDNIPHKGPRVAVPTLEEAEQIYEVRAVLEAMLGRHAASNATPDDIRAMDDAIDLFEEKSADEDLAGMVSSTEAFYAILGKAANRPIAVDLLQTLKARITTLRATSMSSKGRGGHSAQEMRAIARAISKQDAEAAAAACVHHVHRAAKAAKLRLAKVIEAPQPAATKSSRQSARPDSAPTRVGRVAGR